MEEVITLDGKQFLNKKILRGLMYGEGVFETFRYKNKLPNYIQHHHKRLINGAKILNIPPIPIEDYINQINNTVLKHKNKDLYIKTILIGSGDTYLASKPQKSHLLIIAKDYIPPEKKEITLTIAPFKRHSSNPLVKVKSINYESNILAKRYAQEKGFDDAIFLNENNEITETTTANIFWVKGKYLYTPSIDCGLLDGITRKIILQEARKEGFTVVEGRFFIKDLKNAHYIFTTNALHGIIKVKDIML
ncbi:MAG: aminotransferase class IV [Aquificae bacterium]|nr:aminotransferase class IV [Aquificota bacterium]